MVRSDRASIIPVISTIFSKVYTPVNIAAGEPNIFLSWRFPRYPWLGYMLYSITSEIFAAKQLTVSNSRCFSFNGLGAWRKRSNFFLQSVPSGPLQQFRYRILEECCKGGEPCGWQVDETSCDVNLEEYLDFIQKEILAFLIILATAWQKNALWSQTRRGQNSMSGGVWFYWLEAWRSSSNIFP